MSVSMLCSRFLTTRGIIPLSRRFIRFSSTKPIDPSGTSEKSSTDANTKPDHAVDALKDGSFKSSLVDNNNNTGQTNDLNDGKPESETHSPSRYMKAFDKIHTMHNKEEAENEEEPKSFANLLRNSKLMQIGNPAGRIVLGTVFEVVGDDLYIDFGGKFHCVCKTPIHRASEYTRGAKVKVKLLDLEMTSPFLGSDKHVTLLEADAVLIGLHRSNQWMRSPQQTQSKDINRAT